MAGWFILKFRFVTRDYLSKFFFQIFFLDFKIFTKYFQCGHYLIPLLRQASTTAIIPSLILLTHFMVRRQKFNHELNPFLAQQMNQYTLAMQNPDHFNQALQQVQQMAGFPPTSALNQVQNRLIKNKKRYFIYFSSTYFNSSCRHRPTCQTTTLPGTNLTTVNS